MIKNVIQKLDYNDIEFPVQEKDVNKIEMNNNVCNICLVRKISWFFRIYISDQKFGDSMNLLFLIRNDESHYVYIKDFNIFMFHKEKNKNKKWFWRSCLNCFSRKNGLVKQKENCLSINGKQSVKLEKRIIKFESYFKQILVPFKIYADFECNLRSVECNEGSYTEKYQDYIPCSFPYKIVCTDDRFTKPIIFYGGENAAYEFIKAILKE